MNTVWAKTEEGWLYTSNDTKSDMDPGLLWSDSHVKLSLYVEDTMQYLLTVDGRRTYKHLINYNWITLFFGKGPTRKNLKGKTLWTDKNINFIRYGIQPRSYLIVAKREKRYGE